MAFWADKIADEIEQKRAKDIAAGPLVIRDEKTASGRVHAGSLIGVAMHGIISQVLAERGIKNTFYYEINNTDAMDGLPSYLDPKEYEQHMGKPLFQIPSPDGKAENYAEYFGQEFREVINNIGFNPTFYRSSELYLSGKMNDVIRTALEAASQIRKIYKETSRSEKPDDWLPLNVICPNCGKIGTTKVVSFDGDRVHYICQPKGVEWAEGCGHEGDISPFDGNATLPWKVEWAAKFVVMNVHVEGGGKDLLTKGGARDVSDRIAKEVFDREPPYRFINEFFLVGGKKMSSSKGNATYAKEVSDLLPSYILQLLLVRNIKRQVEFNPYDDTIPRLYDLYDTIAEKYWNKSGDDDARLFEEIHGGTPPGRMFLPRFSLMSFLVQMPHMNLEDEVRKLKGGELTDADMKVLEERSYYASQWLTKYASDEYKYELQENLSEMARDFSNEQKRALKKVLEYIDSHSTLDGQELHTTLHDIRKEVGVEPKEFFSAIYLAFLGKESGPKAGWFLSVLDRTFLINRLHEVTSD